MKYIVMLGDGMADYPCDFLGGKTPLELAKKPVMDMLASHGATGLVRTVPDSLKPGSDVANLSVMGYDPEKYYTGRSPLEAVSMGIEMKPTDMVFRCNLVCLSEESVYEDKTMVDYSSDEIPSEESRKLIATLNRELPERFPWFGESFRLYPGISYRHCLVADNPKGTFELTPPHDITTKPVMGHLPAGSGAVRLYEMMRASYDILSKDPVNLERVRLGKKPANSMWIWGEGRKPALPSYNSLYGVDGAVISAVDLIKGIGKCAGLDVIEVAGATGNITTDFAAKGKAALKTLLDGNDFVYIHVEAPDESGHRFEPENKILSIEKIDSDILKPLIDGLKANGEDFRLLLLPDHPTPLSLRTHTRDAVPFVLYDSRSDLSPSADVYSEKSVCRENFVSEGCSLVTKLFCNN